jgi:hypothetical protein
MSDIESLAGTETPLLGATGGGATSVNSRREPPVSNGSEKLLDFIYAYKWDVSDCDTVDSKAWLRSFISACMEDVFKGFDANDSGNRSAFAVYNTEYEIVLVYRVNASVIPLSWKGNDSFFNLVAPYAEGKSGNLFRYEAYGLYRRFRTAKRMVERCVASRETFTLEHCAVAAVDPPIKPKPNAYDVADCFSFDYWANQKLRCYPMPLNMLYCYPIRHCRHGEYSYATVVNCDCSDECRLYASVLSDVDDLTLNYQSNLSNQ